MSSRELKFVITVVSHGAEPADVLDDLRHRTDDLSVNAQVTEITHA